MLHASTQKLILKINELTEAGAIAWKEGEGERPCSVFESEGYVVEVTADPPAVRLLRADGRELERADAAELAATPWPEGSGTFATQVAAMASRAHRIARGAEAAISRILSSLSAPPQRLLEPEPSPAAPEFDTLPAIRPAGRAAESEAAMAAISADMDSLRKSAAPEPLPQSHSVPELQPTFGFSTPPEPPLRPMTISALLTSTCPPIPAAAEPEPEPPEAPPEPAPMIMKSEAAAVVVDPAKVEVVQTAVETPAPEPESPPVFQPVPQRPVFSPDPPLGPRPQPAFGATPSFNRGGQTPSPGPATQPAPAPAPSPAKVTSGGLLITGISVVTRQTIRGEQAPEPPKPRPAPEPRPEIERPPATGPDIYKPWV